MSNPLTKHAWQYQRTMSPPEFTEILDDLGLSLAAAGRYLDVSVTTIGRYKRGAAEIPVAHALLLRAVRDMGVQLVVPPRIVP